MQKRSNIPFIQQANCRDNNNNNNREINSMKNTLCLPTPTPAMRGKIKRMARLKLPAIKKGGRTDCY